MTAALQFDPVRYAANALGFLFLIYAGYMRSQTRKKLAITSGNACCCDDACACAALRSACLAPLRVVLPSR